MEDKIVLSVAIPTFNADLMTRKCLNALTSQTLVHGKFEIIVVDNNSTDDTLDQIKGISEKYNYISVYVETKQGISNTRNRGIKEASGEYILFLDGTNRRAKTSCSLLWITFSTRNPSHSLLAVNTYLDLKQRNLSGLTIVLKFGIGVIKSAF